MALDNKLKSEMASGATYSDQSRTAPTPERTTSRPVFDSFAPGSQSEEEKGASKGTPASQPITNEGAQDTTEFLLKAIEKQLKSLNQSVADLEQEVSACKNPDYRVVFSKIDSARCSIEKMLASVSSTQGGASDSELVAKIAELEELIAAITEKQDRNDRQLAQTLRENANFQIQVRQGMQRDIDALKEQQSGEQFNPILKEVASMYVEYQGLLEDESILDLSRKNLKALFEQLEDLLTDYDAEIIRSEIGSVRQTRSTKIIGKVPTAEQNKHNTIALSRKPGVLRGRTVLYPEFVDVFVYDPTIIIESEAAADTTVTEEKQDTVLEGNEMMKTESSEIAADENAAGEVSEAINTDTSEGAED
ncbi:hypothetical protein NHG23_02715 [Aerococcaceae bacterium NML190073]|nr:hypothetical protein [Aerococcaceae bacterium NML190073]